jgi:hypothetical protein
MQILNPRWVFGDTIVREIILCSEKKTTLYQKMYSTLEFNRKSWVSKKVVA